MVITLGVISFSDVKAASLRAGVAKISITKEKPTALVNDPLYAKAFVISDGKTKAVIISMDVGGIQTPFLNKVRALIKNELNIDGNNVLINVSHNHHVNNQLAENYLDLTVEAVKKAAQNMVPVMIGVGKGREDRITMNRRIKMKDGKEWVIRRATPSPEDHEVAGIAGGFDPEIGILRVDRTNGKPLAVLYNFAGHAYGGVPNKGVTACFPGFASRTIEDNLGNGVVALFLQGAAGDITPVLYKDVDAPRAAEELGTKLGLSTLAALKNIPVKNDGSIKVIREDITFPVRTDSQERINSLEAQKKTILEYFKGIGCGSHGAGTSLNFKSFLPLYIKYMMSPEFPSYYSYRYLQEEKIGSNDLEMLDSDNKRDVQKYLNNIYEMEKLIRIEANLARLRSRIPKSPISTEIQGMKIGDYVLITFPGEVFAQVGLNIKKQSPYKNTFISGYSNGRVGYAPTIDAYDGEGYEVSGSQLAPEWKNIYEEKALEIINKLK